MNDIALLILSENVTLNDKIQIACTPSLSSTNYPNNLSINKSIAVGWGTIQQGGPMSNFLNNVDLTIYDSSKCSLLYSNFNPNSQM